MAQTALSPTRVKVTGETTQIFMGVAGGSGTSTVVTLPIPATATIQAVVVSGATSTTTAYCDTISNTNKTFTVTTASNDLFSYVAYVKGGLKHTGLERTGASN